MPDKSAIQILVEQLRQIVDEKPAKAAAVLSGWIKKEKKT
jgi:hypothetical protein